MALLDNAWYVNSVSYSAVTAWASGVSKVCGNLVRATAPAVGSERVFVCISSIGATGVSEPSWVNTRGAKNVDNDVIWQEATGIAALNGDLTNTPTWTNVKNTAITLGQVIKNNAGTLVLICATAGTAGNGGEPSWAAYTTAGATTVDNTATWTTLGASFSSWSAPHARIANCCTATWQQAGNSVFVGDNHAESQATAIAISVQCAAGKQQYILSVDHAGSTPPTGIKNGASVSISGTSNVALSIGNNTAGGGIVTYLQGITFNGSNSATNGAFIGINSAAFNSSMVFRSCGFSCQAGSSGGAGGFQLNPTNSASSDLKFYNCTFTFNPNQASTLNTMFVNGGRVLFRGGSVTTGGHDQPNTMINATETMYDVTLDAVDLSALVAFVSYVNDISTPGRHTFKNCKMASALVVNVAGSSVCLDVAVINSDPSGGNSANVLQNLNRNVGLASNTTFVRSGGAGESLQLTALSAMTPVVPGLILGPVAIWNPTVGSPVTVTVYGAGATVPTDQQLGFDVRYLGDSASCLGSTAYGYQIDPLVPGANWDADGVSSWSGSPAQTFKKSVTFTPQKAGFLFVYLRMMSPVSDVWYLDPYPVLSPTLPSARNVADYDGWFSVFNSENETLFSLGLEETSGTTVYQFNMPMLGW